MTKHLSPLLIVAALAATLSVAACRGDSGAPQTEAVQAASLEPEAPLSQGRAVEPVREDLEVSAGPEELGCACGGACDGSCEHHGQEASRGEGCGSAPESGQCSHGAERLEGEHEGTGCPNLDGEVAATGSCGGGCGADLDDSQIAR